MAEQHEGHPLLVTDAVLLEIGNALARSYKQEAAAIIAQFLAAAEVDVVPLPPGGLRQAWPLFTARQDTAWGLVDCISCAVMRAAGVSQALTFDPHFVQAGLQAWMRETSYSSREVCGIHENVDAPPPSVSHEYALPCQHHGATLRRPGHGQCRRPRRPLRESAQRCAGYGANPHCARCLFHNTLPVLQGFPWDRHAPAWLPEPGWSPAVPGTGVGLTTWTSRMPGTGSHQCQQKYSSRHTNGYS